VFIDASSGPAGDDVDSDNTDKAPEDDTGSHVLIVEEEDDDVEKTGPTLHPQEYTNDKSPAG